ncbi:response regulator transcription factor [Polycyclovorans algicola]|uniref:response regulator transcription factor n=1 Tax=Polycyclovorans algicola TaxID=616992 RepID=UPI0004A74735|nr:response regulator transcription factor [Polycyclovorans algicola]
MSDAIRLMVVEDDPQMQSRFQRAFEASSAVAVVAWAATAADALALLDETTPDVLLVDLGLPDASGITVIRRAKTLHPCCEIMVVSVFGDQRNVLASIEAGASGYLLKDDTADDFVERIIELRDGGSPITPIIARQLLVRLQPPTPGPEDPTTSLSDREREVLNLLAKGFAYQEIAELLGISTHTVRTYVRRLYEKLQVTSRGQAVFEAQRMHLLPH